MINSLKNESVVNNKTLKISILENRILIFQKLTNLNKLILLFSLIEY
jgi:hypothetical protein